MTVAGLATDPLGGAGGAAAGVLQRRWPSVDLETLIEELAAELRPAADIWREHGVLTKEDARDLLAIPAVQGLLAEARQRWNSVSNASERIRAKAKLSVERSLLSMHVAVNNHALPLNHRNEVFRTLARMAEVDGGGAAGAAGVGAAGSGVNITIDLGAGNVMRVATAGSHTADGQLVDGTLLDSGADDERMGDSDDEEDSVEVDLSGYLDAD